MLVAKEGLTERGSFFPGFHVHQCKTSTTVNVQATIAIAHRINLEHRKRHESDLSKRFANAPIGLQDVFKLYSIWLSHRVEV